MSGLTTSVGAPAPYNPGGDPIHLVDRRRRCRKADCGGSRVWARKRPPAMRLDRSSRTDSVSIRNRKSGTR